jgi:hypothetical protein
MFNRAGEQRLADETEERKKSRETSLEYINPQAILAQHAPKLRVKFKNARSISRRDKV